MALFKPRCTSDSDITVTTSVYEPIEIAGGVNLAGDLYPSTWWGHSEVSKEQIIDWDPEVILVCNPSKEQKYVTAEQVLSDPTLQTVSAVKNGRVYNTKGWYAGWDPATGLCECLYLAKLFYPDRFEDLNGEEECNSILEEFYDTPNLYDWIMENLLS